MADMFKPLYLPGAAPEPELQPSFTQVMSSAFGLENDVVNLYDYMTRPTFTPDPAYDFKAAFASSKLPIDLMPIFAGSLSQEEFNARLGRVQKEYKDKAVLAAGGWGGTVAAMAAGVVSPTALIPFTGQAKGGMAIAEMLGLAAAGSTAQNAALFLNQETRTEAELYGGIAMDTLLMGMMGGAYFGLSKAGRAQLRTNIKGNQSFVEVPFGPGDVPNGSTTTVQVDNVGDEFSGTLRVFHGYSGRDTFVADPTFKGERYEGNSFGDEGLYLDETGKWTSNDANQMMFSVDKVAELDVSFNRALVLTPENAAFVAKAASRNGGRISGKELAAWAREEGYDGLIVRGFDDLQKNTVGPIPKDYSGEPGPTSDGFIAFENNVKAMGLHEEIGQDQIFSFKTDNLTVNRDGLKPGEAMEPRMAPGKSQEAIPDLGRGVDGQSIGAASARTRNTQGAKAAPNRARQAAMDALGKMSPAYRMLTQRFFPSLRDAAAKLDLAGIQQAGLATAEPSARGGSIISRISAHDSQVVFFSKRLDEAYYEYVFDGAKGANFNSPAWTQLKSAMGRIPAGKMSWPEYKQAVFVAHNTGEVPPELAKAAKAFEDFFAYYLDLQKQYMAEFATRGLDVKPLFKELLTDEFGEGVKNYAHHMFDQNELISKMGEFINEFAAIHEKALVEAFGKAKTLYGKRKQKLEFEQLVAKLTPEELNGRLVETEADLEFLEEIPEWQAFRQQRLDINKAARDEGWSKEQLKAALKDLQDNLPEAVRDLQAERKSLMATAKVLRKFGGDALKKSTKLQEDIAKLDEAISGMFRETMPKIEAADISIANIQKKGDAALAPVTTGIKKIVKELATRQAKMAKLLAGKRMNSTSRQKVAELIEKSQQKYAGMLDRLSIVEGKQVALDQRLRELQLLREDAIADANKLVRSRAARIEDLEDKLESEAATVLTPEERARMFDQVGLDLERLADDFQSSWRDRGERSGDPLETDTPDFKEEAVASATRLHQKLTGGEVEITPAYKLLRQDARGAELLRVMKMPFDIKKKWLVKDVELVARAYDRTMAPDLEIWRGFDGSVNGQSLLAEMQDEVTAHMARIATASHVRLPKGWVDKATAFKAKVAKRLTNLGDADDIYLGESNFSSEAKEGFVEISPELRSQLGQSVLDAAKVATEDFDVAISRLRATRGVPRDGGSLWWRGGKFVKNLNVTTMMGGVLTSSISDIARPMWQHGVAKTLDKGWLPFVRSLASGDKRYRLRSKEINMHTALNLEPVLHSRAQAVFDLAEDSLGRTRLERGVAMAAQKMGLVALYDYWTAGMKTIAGNVVHATMAAYVPRVAEALAKGKVTDPDMVSMMVYLRNLGLGDLDIHRIAEQMRKPGGVEEFSNGGVLPNIDRWDDPAAYQAYRAAVISEVNKLIVTPGLERPNVVDENMAYSLLFQFKSFTFASNSRMAMSALQGNDPYLMQGVAFSLALGAVSYYTYALSAGGHTWERANEGNTDEWIWEAVKRSGILGALSIGADIGAEIPQLTGDDTNLLFRKPSGLLGELLGPTYSQLDKMAEVIKKSGTGDAEQKARNLRSLRQIFVPYQNHFLFRQFFDRVGDALQGN